LIDQIDPWSIDGMVISKTARVPGLDLLRALAVALVVVFHYSGNSGGAILTSIGRYGWMGVDLFFVLSGYLIGSQLFKPLSKNENFSVKNFFIRRILRTLPNFLAVLAIYFFLPSLREQPILPALWRFLTFTQNIGLNRSATGAFSHAWSLCVEEQFYLILPLSLLLFFKRPTEKKVVLFLALAFFLGLILRSLIWLEYLSPLQSTAPHFSSLFDESIYYPTYTHLDGLLVGITLALIKTFRPGVWQKLLNQGLAALGFSGALLALALLLNEYRWSAVGATFLFPCVAFGFGALVVAALSPKIFFSYFPIPGIATLAKLSYAIYLIQKLVFHWSEKNLVDFGIQPFSYLGLLATLLLCLFGAALLYFSVERPFLKLRDRLLSRV
jgi:peptidoglycan/LPS O-acetylase OafA/YrhL